MLNGDHATTDRAFGNPAFRLTLLFLLFATAAITESVRLSSLHHADLWLRLRLGEWVLANQSVPTTGLFSQAVDLTWRDFSWVAGSLVLCA